MTEDLHEYLVACIRNIFGDMLCPRGVRRAPLAGLVGQDVDGRLTCCLVLVHDSDRILVLGEAARVVLLMPQKQRDPGLPMQSAAWCSTCTAQTEEGCFSSTSGHT